MKKSLAVKITAIVLVIVSVGAICTAMIFDSYNSVTNDISKMIERAEMFRDKGENENAYYQLELYIQATTDNYDACMMIADWYADDGNIKKSEEFYQKAVVGRNYNDNDLNINNKIKNFNCAVSKAKIEIKPAAKYTKDMKLIIYNENLAPSESVTGKISGTGKELEENKKCRTTEWFDIDESGESLTMSGGFNCAIWQFCDSEGAITAYTDSGTFRSAENVTFLNRSYSTAKIPKNSVKARVTYFDESIENPLESNDVLTITYGSSVSGYTYSPYQEFELPDITENQSIVYADGKWILNDNGDESELELDKIKTSRIMRLGISGEICGYVTVTDDSEESVAGDRTKQYGIRYKADTSEVACQRTGSAQGMNFDYKVGDNWVNGTGNDFDSAYPWCEMKLCNVSTKTDGTQKITYEDDSGFAVDGSNGNVMVEIPKFYVKREIKKGYEYLTISGKKYDGYELEPVFLNEDGSEAEHVYMSAYLGTEIGDSIVSVSGKYPTLNLTYDTTLSKAEANGSGYSEVSFLMISALQKLFLVETATLDSTSIFAGDTEKMYYYDKTGVKAVESAESTNVIKVKDTFYSQKLVEGSSIILFTDWENYSNSKTAHREIESITKNDDETLSIRFSGKPVKITKNKTAVSNVPERAGKTDSLSYCTAALEGNDGKVSFKYRYIENLYGSALIMLDDDAYVCNGYFSYTDAQGNVHTIDQPVAEQPQDLTDYSKANYDYCIGTMSYDQENPLIMVPTQVGGKASAYSGYCDYWSYENNYDGMNYFILYGGAQDNAHLAGLFQMRVIMNSYEFKGSFHSARIMYKK